MNKELELKLKEQYPVMFQEMYGDMTRTCMHWGCTCGDGWYTLIDTLCSGLQWHHDKNGYGQVVVEQVKEKFGTLRFYYRIEPNSVGKESARSDDYLDGMVSFAESMSGHICEVCGKPGTVNGRGWLSCRCEDCRGES